MSKLMTFKALLDAWAGEQTLTRTRETYAIHLTTDDAARLQALSDLYPGMDPQRLITDLLSMALDHVEAAIPYVPGDKVIREDEFGDPVYEDKGLTPRFLELVRKHRDSIEKS